MRESNDDDDKEDVSKSAVTELFDRGVVDVNNLPSLIPLKPIFRPDIFSRTYSPLQFPCRTIPPPFLHGVGYSSLPPPPSVDSQCKAIYR